jgi:predicted DNA-binding transcriptional regulator AlpA
MCWSGPRRAPCMSRAEHIATSTGESMQPLLTIQNLVEFLHRSARSIHRDVAAGRFPKPIKLGRSNRWRPTDIEAWLESVSKGRRLTSPK